VPQSLAVTAPKLLGIPVIRFDDHYFKGTAGYNRLLLSPEFYQRLRSYNYILIYQLDCLVFSNDLLSWCAKGWDYVGAPWFKDHKADVTEGLWAVGNGGLSLRRVSSCLKVLRSMRWLRSPVELGWQTGRFANSRGLRLLVRVFKTIMHACGYQNTIRHFLKGFQQNEDIFWSFHSKMGMPNFKIPAPIEALHFAFEHAPKWCFEQNGKRLPFACHAWYKTDPAFWSAFLIQESMPHEKMTLIK
jgi:hypothetical protein